MSLTRLYLLITLFKSTVFSLIFAFIPQSRDAFIQEDHFLENLTALLYFICFVVGTIIILRLKKKHFHWLYYLLPISGLIFFLDELSFGERIWDFKFRKFGGVKIDGVHDIVELVYRKYIKFHAHSENSWIWELTGILIIFLISLTLIYIFKHHLNINNLKNIFLQYKPLLFLLGVIIFASIAICIDFGIFDYETNMLVFIEELLEMNAALSLLFACLAISITPKSSKLPINIGSATLSKLR